LLPKTPKPQIQLIIKSVKHYSRLMEQINFLFRSYAMSETCSEEIISY